MKNGSKNKSVAFIFFVLCMYDGQKVSQGRNEVDL